MHLVHLASKTNVDLLLQHSAPRRREGHELIILPVLVLFETLIVVSKGPMISLSGGVMG
jgi:hypothetical protein